LPPGVYRTGRTIKAKCCHRGNTIGGSHRVLPPGAETEGVLLLGRMSQGSIVTGGILYGAYDGSGMLPPGEHYCHDLARDYLAIKHTDTHLGPTKHSNMLDSCHDLTRDHVIIRHANKNLEVTRIPDMRIRVLGYNYDYMIKVMAKVLI